MQVADIKMVTRICFYSSILFLTISCSPSANTVRPTYNKSGYRINFSKSDKETQSDSIYVSVRIRDRKNENATMYSNIIYACETMSGQRSQYDFKVKKFDVPNQIKITTVGYFSVETEPFINQEYDSIFVDFYMMEDDRPLIHCENE